MFEINLIKKAVYFTILLLLTGGVLLSQKPSIDELASSVIGHKDFDKMQGRHLALVDSFTNLNTYNAHFYYLDSLIRKARAKKDDKFEAVVWMSKGNFFLGTGNNYKSIEAFRNSITIMERINFAAGLCNAYTNMGNTYFYMMDNEKALMYYKTAISYCKKIEDPKSNIEEKLANLYNNLGSVYCSKNDFVFGKTYFLMALNVWLRTKDSISIGYAYNNFAQIYQVQNQNDSAEIYYTKALEIKSKFGTKLDKADGYRNLAAFYNSQKQNDKALEYVSKALTYLDTTAYTRQLVHCYSILNHIYRVKKDYRNELKYFKLHTAANDSARSRENISSLTKMEMQFEFSKVHLADSLKTLNEIKLRDVKISEKKQQSYFLILIIVLTIVALSIIYSRFKVTKKQKQIIEEKNKEITDSINYARKIQNSIMANESYMDSEIKRLRKRKKGD